MTAHRNPDLFGETQLSLFEETTEMDMQTEWLSLCARRGYSRAVAEMNRSCAGNPKRRTEWEQLQCETATTLKTGREVLSDPAHTKASKRNMDLYTNTHAEGA